jgi:hypothetical protein
MEFLAGTGGAQTFGPCLRGPEDVRQLIVLASCFGLVLSTIDIDIAVRCRDFGRRLRKSRDRRLWGYGQPAQLGRNPPPRSAADCDRRAFYFIRVRYVLRLTRQAEQFALKVCARIVVGAPAGLRTRMSPWRCSQISIPLIRSTLSKKRATRSSVMAHHWTLAVLAPGAT